MQTKVNLPKEDVFSIIQNTQIGSNPYQQIAGLLHNISCKNDHNTNCSWYSETKNGRHDWSGYEHSRYLSYATQVVHNTNMDAYEVLRIVAEISEVMGSI